MYLAPDDTVPAGCSAPPSQGETLGPTFEGGQPDPPLVNLTLAQWRGRGLAKEIGRPAGRVVRRKAGATVKVDRFAFDPPLLSIPRGATVRWLFRDDRFHDATLVRGPRGFATATVRDRTERQRFDVPGEYRLYCSIHPVFMSQVVKVRGRR